MIRTGLLCLLLFVGLDALSQEAALETSVMKLDSALLRKDTASLWRLLHDEVGYGHSNGWVQSKNEVIGDMLSGKLEYKKIQSSDFSYAVNGDWASVRSRTAVVFMLDGKEGVINLHVLQVWVRTAEGWRLAARQSTKI